MSGSVGTPPPPHSPHSEFNGSKWILSELIIQVSATLDRCGYHNNYTRQSALPDRLAERVKGDRFSSYLAQRYSILLILPLRSPRKIHPPEASENWKPKSESSKILDNSQVLSFAGLDIQIEKMIF